MEAGRKNSQEVLPEEGHILAPVASLCPYSRLRDVSNLALLAVDRMN